MCHYFSPFRFLDALNTGAAAGGAGFCVVSKHSACINFAFSFALCAGDDLRAAGCIRAVCAQKTVVTLGAKDIFSVEFVAAVRAVIHHGISPANIMRQLKIVPVLE